jgi:hypothetical protein
MSNVVELYPIPEKLAEDERVRAIAQRALAPPDLPFDGLHIEAAMVLNQLGLAAMIPEEVLDEPKNPIEYGDDSS